MRATPSTLDNQTSNDWMDIRLLHHRAPLVHATFPTILHSLGDDVRRRADREPGLIWRLFRHAMKESAYQPLAE